MALLSDSLFREFFLNSPQAMWIYDLDDLRFLAVNKAVCTRYGYTEDEFMGMTLLDIRTAQEAERLRGVMSVIRERGASETPAVWEHWTKAGARMLVEILASVLNVDGQTVGVAVLRDVTHERELESERNRLFELSGDIMVIRTLDDKLVSVNPAYERILGWSPEETANFDPKDLIHPEDRGSREAARNAALRDGGSHTWECRARARDGSYHWFQWLGTIDVANDRWYSVGRDVSKLVSQAEHLAQSEANLAWAQQISHIGSWSLDATTHRFTLSDEYYRITGHWPGGYEPTWPNIIACVHPEDRALVEKRSAPVRPETWIPEEIEVRIVRPNGDIRHVISFVDASFWPNGDLRLMHGTIQDVTDRKNAEEARRWLAEIVSSSNDAIIGASLDGTVLSWNNAAERLFGYTAVEMIGQQLVRLVPAKRWTEAADILDRLRKGERVPEFETERVDRSGRIFEASFMISPIRSAEGRMIGAAVRCRDISTRKEVERQLASRLAQLTALRNIDVAIMGTADLAHTLEVIVAELLAITDSEAACIFVASGEGTEPTLAASGSRAGDPVTGDRLSSARNLANLAVSENRIASSALAGTSYLGLTDNDDRREACDARPLVSKGAILGALTVHYRTGVRRSSEQYHFVDTLAGQAAIAIESAKLFTGSKLLRDGLSQ